MTERTYVYGIDNGSTYTMGGSGEETQFRTHWDPRLVIEAVGELVQVGIVPASSESTNDTGIWDPADGQFLTMSRDGLNRLIRAARQCRDAAYGKDE